MSDDRMPWYLEDKGARCPFCRGNHIEGDRYDPVATDVIRQNVQCYDCGGFWTGVYRLSSLVVDGAIQAEGGDT